MNITKIAVRRPITTIMCLFVVAAFGILSIINLKIDLLPNMNIPVAIVMTTYSGAGPEEIENLVTKPLEGVLGTVQGVDTISSTSSEGSSIVILQFDESIDIDNAALDMREKVDMIKAALPGDASDPMVMKIDINQMSAITIGITSEDMSLVDLHRLIDTKVLNRLERLDGVASVDLSGGREKEIKITLLEDKLRGYGVSESQISGLLMAENRNTPVGSVTQGEQSLTIRTEGEFSSLEDIKQLPVTTSMGKVIFLEDIATIEEVYKEVSSYSTINGTPSITLSIGKQSTANTVNVSDAIAKELAKISADYPKLTIVTVSDPGVYVKEAIANVTDSAISGGLLAVAVLYVFLRNYRSTMIVAISIPVSIVATFVLMYYSNITLNMMSLGGLTLGVGMLVDNSIVVLESIYRKIEEGEDKVHAAIEGTREVALSVTASTLTTIAVFLPITFAGGILAQIFNQLSMTIAFSLMSSLIVAITFVPMASSLFLTKEHLEGRHKTVNLATKLLDKVGESIVKLEQNYKKVLHWALNHRKKTVLITVAFIIVTFASLLFVGTTFMAATDEGIVMISFTTPRGTVLEETRKVSDKIYDIIKDEPTAKDITVSVAGGSVLYGGGSANTGDVILTLVPKAERKEDSTAVAERISKQMQGIPGAEITVSAAQMSMGSYGGASVSINIYGEDLDVLKTISNDMARIVGNVEGTRDVSTSMQATVPQAVIKIDRLKSTAYGISASSVASILKTAVSGSQVTTLKKDGTELDVMLSQDTDNMEYINQVENVLIPSPLGINVPLYEIANIEMSDTPTSINRDNNQKYVSVSAALGDGVSMGQVTSELTRQFAGYIMPEGYTYKFAGTQEQMDEAFYNLFLALLMAILLVYMIMAAEFESLIYPFIVMFSIPVAMSGGLFGLFLTNTQLDITGFLGLIMLAGIVINNAIVLIDYTNLLIRERGYELFNALLEAGSVRLRPILMTTATTVLALVPIVLGAQEGSEMMKGLATVVVFGLTLSTIVTLVFVPVIYLSFNGIKQKRQEKREAKRQRKLAKQQQ